MQTRKMNLVKNNNLLYCTSMEVNIISIQSIYAILTRWPCENLIVLNSHSYVRCTTSQRYRRSLTRPISSRYRAPIQQQKNSGPVVKPRSQMHLSICRCSRSHWASCQYKCKCHWEPCKRIHWRSLEDDCSRRILQMPIWNSHRNWIALRIGTYRNVDPRYFVSRHRSFTTIGNTRSAMTLS